MTVPSLEISRLTVHFGSRENPVWAVENLDINIQKGESFGLVGESGSGKSTVLRAICGLVPIHNGKLRVDGEELKYPRSKSFYQRVQMVFQDPYGSLHPKHTVDRTLNDPLAIHKLDRREYRIGKALDEVGLDESFRFRYPHQLSGGQRQRIAIARALILQPKILLLDEPTSALDASIQAEVLNLLDRLKAERGLTYLMVSHDLAVVSHMCDRLLVMQFGRSVELLDKSSLRDQSPRQQYTMNLLEASKGFRKSSTEK
jgi:peptide/nickel transport system ATP-binding protein